MENSGLILLVDDDANCLNTTAALLRNRGYQCDVAAAVEEALELLKKTQYDLLLSDIEMPGNCDLRLIQALPQIQPGLAVILMTGYPSVETAVNSMGLAVSAYLIKPLNPEDLLVKTNRAIELSRCRRKVIGTRERLLAACDDLKQIEASLSVPSNDNSKASMMAFLDLTMQNVAASLLDLRQLFETLVPASELMQGSEWLQSARPMILINALRETIGVLAKTKGAFKSKELADLRRKLESLIQDKPDSGGA
jgi:DNA-binding response OmpR family regulator